MSKWLVCVAVSDKIDYGTLPPPGFTTYPSTPQLMSEKVIIEADRMEELAGNPLNFYKADGRLVASFNHWVFWRELD
jgi:hypothetical protein